MSSISLIASLSLVVAVIPALGFPRSWEEILLFVIGGICFVAALMLRKKSAKTEAPVDTQSAFVENAHSSKAESL